MKITIRKISFIALILCILLITACQSQVDNPSADEPTKNKQPEEISEEEQVPPTIERVMVPSTISFTLHFNGAEQEGVKANIISPVLDSDSEYIDKSMINIAFREYFLDDFKNVMSSYPEVSDFTQYLRWIMTNGSGGFYTNFIYSDDTSEERKNEIMEDLKKTLEEKWYVLKFDRGVMQKPLTEEEKVIDITYGESTIVTEIIVTLTGEEKDDVTAVTGLDRTKEDPAGKPNPEFRAYLVKELEKIADNTENVESISLDQFLSSVDIAFFNVEYSPNISKEKRARIALELIDSLESKWYIKTAEFDKRMQIN